jgi:8-oxo-dGTP pyrophosphatase MutT (NUDIX family)
MRNFLDILRRIEVVPTNYICLAGREPLAESSEDGVCKTPGSEFHITIEPDEIGGVVELPGAVSLDGMDQDQAEEAEDMIHDALEEVVAKLVAEIDNDADAHWEKARAADPMQEQQHLQELKRPNLGSAWVVIEDPETGRVLLGKRAKSANNAGQWNLFGGGIEGGESALQTALRELWEEGGIKASPDQVSKLPDTPPNITIFVLSMTDKQVRKALRLNPKEVAKVRWCDPDKLPENLHKSALGLVHAGRAAAEKPDWHTSAGAGNAMRRAMDVVEGKKGSSRPTR